MTLITCQTCGREGKRKITLSESQDHFDDWCVHNIGTLSGPISITTCPMCSEMDIDEVFETYKRRIKAGFDDRFH